MSDSILVAIIPSVVTLVGVLLSNSKSQAVLEVKIDQLSTRVEKHNQLIERTYALEKRMAVIEHELGGTSREGN